jgi:hypothetical protein
MTNRLAVLTRFVVGYRDDLDLPSRWWHRAFVVLFSLSVVFTALVVWVINKDNDPPFKTENLVVIDNLSRYPLENKAIDNNTRLFSEIGMTAIRLSSGELTPYSLTAECDARMPDCIIITPIAPSSASSSQAGPILPMTAADYALVHTLSPADEIGAPPPQSSSSSSSPSSRTRAGRHTDTPSAYTDIPLLEPADIVATKFTDASRARITLKAIVPAIWVTFVIAVAVLNMYYRAFIFIVFGKRQEQNSAGL